MTDRTLRKIIMPVKEKLTQFYFKNVEGSFDFSFLSIPEHLYSKIALMVHNKALIMNGEPKSHIYSKSL